MSLELLSLPPNVDACASVVTTFTTNPLAAGESAFVVVDEPVERRAVSTALLDSLTAGSALVDIQLGSFRDLARSLASRFSTPRPELPRRADHVLVGRALATSSPYPGFAASVTRTVRRLRAAAVAGDAHLHAELSTVAGAQRTWWLTLLDRYRCSLGELDVWDDAQWAAAAIDSAPHAAQQMQRIVVAGVDELLPWQITLLTRLAGVVHLHVVLQYEPNRRAFDRHRPVLAQLRERDLHLRVEEGPKDTRAQTGQSAIARLAGTLYNADAEPFDATHGLRFGTCAGALQQAEEICREALRMHGEGYAWSEIACLMPDPSEHAQLIEAVFARNGVPVRVEAPRKVFSTPLGQAVGAMLDAALSNDSAAFLRYARSGASGLDAVAVEQFAHWLSGGVGDDVDLPARTWQQHPIVSDAIRALNTAASGAPAGALFRECILDLTMHTRGDVRLAQSLLEAVVDADYAMRETTRLLTLSEIRMILDALVIPAPLPEPGDAVVTVAAMAASRLRRWRGVIVCGFESGAFGSGDDTGLVARDRVTVAVGRAREQLSFLRMATSSDGSVLAPHPCWLELRRLVPERVLPDRVRTLASPLLHDPGITQLGAEQAAASLPAPTRSGGPGTIAGRSMPAVGDHVSVSDIEAYAVCPARFYVQRRLMRDAQQTQHGAQLLGKIIHVVLAEIVPTLVAAGGSDTTRQAIIAELPDHVAAAACQQSVTVPAYLAERAARYLRRCLATLPIYGTRCATELDLGDEPFAGSQLTLAGTRVSGRVDRVDYADDGGAVIVDYKTGSDKPAYDSPDAPTSAYLQSGLYWAALAHDQRASVYASLYQFVASAKPGHVRGLVPRELFGRVIDDPAQTHQPSHKRGRNGKAERDEMEERVADTLLRATAFVEQMRAGEVPGKPLKPSLCDSCTERPICRLATR